METWWQTFRSSRVGIYLQFLIPLSLLTALLFGTMSMTGCFGCSSGSTQEAQRLPGQNASFQCVLRGDGQGAAGQTTHRKLGGYTQTDPGPSTVTYSYTPPSGAHSFTWDPNHPPQNPGGPPPYIFANVPANTDVTFSFTLPAAPPSPYGASYYVEGVSSDNGDGTTSSSAIRTRAGGRLLSRPKANAPGVAGAAANLPPRQVDPLWQVGRWVDAPGIALTTELCNDWLGVLQSDSAFLAARLPIVPPAQPTQSYTLPLAFGSPNSSTLAIIEYGEPAPLFSLPVELRLERLTFAENQLPRAENEAYVTLGLSQAPTSCPPGIDLAADTWSLFAEAWLDLRGQPGNCTGCVVPTYYCYEGEELPALPPLAPAGLPVKAIASAAGLTSYQGEGITCLGPHYITLDDTQTWEFGGASSGWFTPTVPISFHHFFVTPDTMTFTVEMTSDLPGAEWGIYEGEWDRPTLPLVEIAGPVRVDGFRDIWVIADAATPPTAGDYTLLLTAAREDTPVDQAITSDLIWIGDWIAPPPPTEGTTYTIYLPLVQRVHP